MILCDIDNVLATNCGRDTAIGEPIYRTFVQMPTAFHDIRRACVPIHVVTAKAEREARQILAAIGLSAWVDSVHRSQQAPLGYSARRSGSRPRTDEGVKGVLPSVPL
jgi:phosphoglycolate phosphatase-like HAD superfamily hydrolase